MTIRFDSLSSLVTLSIGKNSYNFLNIGCLESFFRKIEKIFLNLEKIFFNNKVKLSKN